MASATGYDMVVGGEVELFGNAASGEPRSADIEVFAVIAVAAAAIGALVAFADFYRRFGAAISVLGAAALIALMISLRAEYPTPPEESGVPLAMSFVAGFWLSIAAFGGAAVLALWPTGSSDA